jgi:hypothetical protein
MPPRRPHHLQTKKIVHAPLSSRAGSKCHWDFSRSIVWSRSDHNPSQRSIRRKKLTRNIWGYHFVLDYVIACAANLCLHSRVSARWLVVVWSSFTYSCARLCCEVWTTLYQVLTMWCAYSTCKGLGSNSPSFGHPNHHQRQRPPIFAISQRT